jgi:hypothetical protein
MKRFKGKLALVVLSTQFLLCFQTVIAQQTTSTAGGVGLGTGGTVCYTVGQVAYNFNSTNNTSVLQGVQQPFEISVNTSIQQAEGKKLNCIAYPNPTQDLLILKLENSISVDCIYELYETTGKLLINRTIESNETDISLSSYKTGVYFLKVIQNGNEIIVFKIVKN